MSLRFTLFFYLALFSIFFNCFLFINIACKHKLYNLLYIKLIIIDKITDKNELNKNLNLHQLKNIKESIKIIKKDNIETYTNKFLIITDSEFWINVITKWCNNWIKKNQYLDKKNVDIILYINYYLNLLNNENILIDFKFTYPKHSNLPKVVVSTIVN